VIVEASVVITKRGQPVTGTRRKFRFSSTKGEFIVADDLNDPLPKDIEDLFYK